MNEKYTSFAAIPKFTDAGHYAVDYPLDSLVRWVKMEEEESSLQMNPEFQRGHVWTEEQLVKYMEFILRGGRTGRDLYFNCPDWHRSVAPEAYKDFVCVDGLQRITAIRRFIENEIKVFGSYYREFTDSLRLSSNTMRVHINDLKLERDVLQWYVEMNSGGTPHSDEEIKRVKKLMEKQK